MAKRQSVEIPGFSHSNPIPGASRIGSLVMSSIISGRAPDGSGMPETVEEQIENIFKHIRAGIEAAGGGPEHIIKVDFWMEDPASGRALLNDEWVKLFPDEDSRPARHTQHLPAGGASKISCNFTAVIE